MFDKNHLKHNMELYTRYQPSHDYKCTKCGVVVWYSKHNDLYFLIDKDGMTQYSGNDRELLTLTCEEYIIKGIIE